MMGRCKVIVEQDKFYFVPPEAERPPSRPDNPQPVAPKSGKRSKETEWKDLCSTKKTLLLRPPGPKLSSSALVLLAFASAPGKTRTLPPLPERGECAPPGPRRPGTIAGKVVAKSATGQSPVPRATVFLASFDDSGPVPTTTDDRGCYVVSVPRAGKYTLVIKAEGHTTASFFLVADKDLGLRLFGGPPSLEVVELPDRRESDAPGAPIEFETGARRLLIGSDLASVLPLAGIRNLDQLARLAPGVYAPPEGYGGGPGISSGVGSAGQFSVNGMRARENNFTIDGADNNEEDVGVRRQGFLALSPQPLDSIRDFQVTTMAADARYGRNLGGQVHALSLSGGDRFSLTAHGRFTHEIFNARDYFDQNHPLAHSLIGRGGKPVLLDGKPISERPNTDGESPLWRSQAGVLAGGALRAIGSKPLYLMAAIEQQSQRGERETHFAVPTPAQRAPLLELARQPSAAGSAVLGLMPLPNNPDGPLGGNTFTDALRRDGAAWLASIKVDRELAAWNSRFSLRYAFTRDWLDLAAPSRAIAAPLRSSTRLNNVALFLNTSFTNRVSQSVRMSYGRTASNFQPGESPAFERSKLFPRDPYLVNRSLLIAVGGPDQSEFLSASSTRGMQLLSQICRGCLDTESLTGPLGQLQVAGHSSVGYDPFHFPQNRVNETQQIADTVSIVTSRHQMAVGFDIRRNHLTSTVERNFRPVAAFHGMSELDGKHRWIDPVEMAAMGVPGALLHTLAVNPDPYLATRFSQWNFFIHDEIRLRPNLHLTAGMRAEVNLAPNSDSGRFERAFQRGTILEDIGKENCSGGRQPNASCNELSTKLIEAFPENFRAAFNADRKNLLYRVGLAWRPFGLAYTVVRLGLGSFAGQFPGAVLNESRSVFPAYLPVNYANFAVPGSAGLFNLASPSVRQAVPGLAVVKPGTLNVVSDPAQVLTVSLRNVQSTDPKWLSPFLTVSPVLPTARMKAPKAYHYGLTLEHQLDNGKYTVSVAYVGTMARKLLRITTPAGGPRYSSIGRLESESSADSLPIFRGSIGKDLVGSDYDQFAIADSFVLAPLLYEASANSLFNSFQAGLRKRFSGGLQFGGNYSYGRSIDDASDFFDNGGAFALAQNSRKRSEVASSNFDTRHRSTLYFTFDPGASKWWANRWFPKGLHASGVWTAQTGRPFTVNSAYDVNRDGNLTDRLDRLSTGDPARGLHVVSGGGAVRLRLDEGLSFRDLLAGRICGDGRGCDGSVGRNTFTARGLNTLDLRVGHNWRIRGLMVTVFAELFNLLNRTQFAGPVRILEAPGFGSSIETLGPSREIQFGITARLGGSK